MPEACKQNVYARQADHLFYVLEEGFQDFMMKLEPRRKNHCCTTISSHIHLYDTIWENINMIQKDKTLGLT